MKLLIRGFLVLFSLQLSAQDGSYTLGARSAGMGGASLTIGDEYSLFNNVGALGRLDHHSAFASYQSRYGIPEFQVIGAGGIYHSPIGNAGIGFYRFGDELFSQQRLHLAFGNKLQMVSLGVGIDLIQYAVSSVGTRQVLAIQFGGVAEITPKLFFGAHIFNLNQADLNVETDDRVPTVMKGGISYRPTEELMLNAEVEKDLDFDEKIKVGIEYQIVSRVFMRTGISTDPKTASFGVGFHPKNLAFDYAFSNDNRLGNAHEVSFSYAFKQ